MSYQGTTTEAVEDLFDEAGRIVNSFTKWVNDVLGDAGSRDFATLFAAHERIIRGLEASLAHTINAADDRGAHFADGHRSIGPFLKASVRLSNAEVTHRKRAAKLVRLAPEVGDALAAGTLGVAQAREIGRVLANPRIDDTTVAGAVPEFLDHARNSDFETFRNHTTQWERAMDFDGAHKDDDAVHDNRDVQLSDVWNTFYLDGKFGTAQGVQIRAVFDKYVEAEFTKDWEAAKAKYGDDVSVDKLERTPAQRRADAFHAMVMAAAGAPLDGKNLEVIVNILVDQATYERQAAELAGGTPPPPPPAGTRRMCQTPDGIPIDPRDAVTASLVGFVRRVVIGADGVIINLGRKRRLFTGNNRVAALLQAGLDFLGRCGWPGCRRRHVQLDHAAEWVADGGATDVSNAEPDCGHHNRWKTTNGYTARRDEHGHWHTYRSDGSEIKPY